MVHPFRTFLYELWWSLCGGRFNDPLAMPAGVCALGAKRLYWLTRGHSATRRAGEAKSGYQGITPVWVSCFFHSQAVSAKNGMVHG